MNEIMDAPVSAELLDQASNLAGAAENGRAMQQVRTQYTTAVAVQQPRSLQSVRTRLLAEAKMAGESFYYGWGAGRDRIEGPSIGLAMAAARCFGNSAVDMLPIQELEDSWIVTSAFIDLETGYTLTRQFRQSKSSVVHGKHDVERKMDIRFQIAQSKAARNVVTNALPKWLIDAAINEAKSGVREKLEQYVASNGLAAAAELILKGLAKYGVLEPHVLEKCEVAEVRGMTLDHLVMLRGDLYALDNGQDYAASLFPAMDSKEPGSKVRTSDVNKEIDAETKTEKSEEKPKAEDPWTTDAERKAADGKLFDAGSPSAQDN